MSNTAKTGPGKGRESISMPGGSISDPESREQSAEQSEAELQDIRNLNVHLTRSRQFHAKLLQRMPNPVIVTDAHDLIIRFNDAAADLFEWREEELIGEPVDRILGGENRPEVLSSLSTHKKEVRTWSGDLVGKTRTDATVLLEVTVSPVRCIEDSPASFLYSAIDVTEARRIHDLIVQSDHQTIRGDMASEFSHKMNNHLAVLGGCLDLVPLMLKQGKMDKIDHRLEVMRAALDKIAAYCDSLKGGAAKPDARVPRDLNGMITGLVKHLKPQAKFLKTHFKLDLCDGIAGAVVDTIAVQQVVVALLNNAAEAIERKSTGNGWIAINSKVLDEGSSVRISVEDNGDGIAADMMAILSHQRFSNQPGGRGLGLVKARSVIEDHGGEFRFESELGSGSRFTLELPAVSATQGAESEELRGSSSS